MLTLHVLLLQSFEAVAGAQPQSGVALERALAPPSGGGGGGGGGGGTFLRFFAGWPIGERASFKSLRAIGGFLVDGSVDVRGVVTGVSVLSTVGGACTLLPFSAGQPAVRDGQGATVAVTRVRDRLFAFATRAGERYSIR